MYVKRHWQGYHFFLIWIYKLVPFLWNSPMSKADENTIDGTKSHILLNNLYWYLINNTYLTPYAYKKKRGIKMNDYHPLYKYFEAASNDVITLHFQEIEQLIGAKLPMSAYKYVQWWSNSNTKAHPHSKAWTENGYVTFDVKNTIGCEKITFQKRISWGWKYDRKTVEYESVQNDYWCS